MATRLVCYSKGTRLNPGVSLPVASQASPLVSTSTVKRLRIPAEIAPSVATINSKLAFLCDDLNRLERLLSR